MNSVCLVGRLTREPELRYTPSGMAVVRFTLAVDRRMSKDKKAEAEQKNQPTADFISCTAWGKTAETISNYVQKGQRVGVTGRIQTGSYDDKDGHRVYTTDVIVESFDFLESMSGQVARQSQNGYGQAPVNTSFNNVSRGPQDSFGGIHHEVTDDGFFPINNEEIPF